MPAACWLTAGLNVSAGAAACAASRCAAVGGLGGADGGRDIVPLVRHPTEGACRGAYAHGRSGGFGHFLYIHLSLLFWHLGTTACSRSGWTTALPYASRLVGFQGRRSGGAEERRSGGAEERRSGGAESASRAALIDSALTTEHDMPACSPQLPLVRVME